MKKIVLFCFVPLALVTADMAYAENDVRIGIQDCTQGKTHVREFTEYGEFAITCRFPGGAATNSVVIISVDIERFCEKYKAECERKFPLPLILDQAGKVVGRLPDNFPGEAAVHYDIVLKKIAKTWPMEIILEGESSGVGGAPVWAPLIWDKNLHEYRVRSVPVLPN